MYLIPDDLYTHIYPEIKNIIVRNDQTITQKAIDAAVSEVRSYLNRYDLNAIFGTETDEPTFHDPYLDSIVKDVAVWNILKLANPNIDMAVFRSAYQDAIAYLTNIQKGLVEPAYPPAPEIDGFNPSNTIFWDSNPRRHNHY